MFGHIKQVFLVLLRFRKSLPSVVNAPNHIKYTSLNNQKCMTQRTTINLHPNEYTQELHYYPFPVKLDRCLRRCGTLNDLFNRICISNKT